MQLRLPLILVFMMWWCLPAQAFSCSFSNTGINFGNVALGGGFQTATGTFTADCTGTPGQIIRICPNFNEGSGGSSSGGSPRLMSGPSVTQLRYDLFRSNGVGQVWGSYTWGYSPRPPVLSVTINNNGFGSVSQTIFGRLYNQQGALGPGTYSSSFAGSQTQIDYGLSSNFNCSATLSPRVQNVPFIVRTTNNSTCTVTATNMDFGSRLQLTSAVTATNTITATCTSGTQFEIGLNHGTSGSIFPNTRRMLGAVTPSQMVNYQIYRDAARTQIWGNTIGSSTISSTATGTAQIFTGYGLVPAQPTPYSQLYTDNLVVTITY
jgi:spore coat protein U-like protein